ncbi:MAG: hypothetical protein VZR11_09135 [Succinimonas sp.]|nr:hypothetical protein [Succinimonas sp.]
MEKSAPDEIPPEKLLYQTGYFTLRQESRSCAKLAIATDEVSESLSGLYFEISRMTPSEAVRSRLAKAGVIADSYDIAGMFEIFNEVLSEGASSYARLFDDENNVRVFDEYDLPK